VFGLGFGELLVVMLVAVVVLGPKDLPRYMRKAGELASKLRRLAFDMREKSGIDEVLRAEGLDHDIAEIRKLARGEIGGVVAAVRSTADAIRPNSASTAATPSTAAAGPPAPALFTTDREYPPEGADAYGALPETASVYDGDLPPSDLASDPHYSRGDGEAAPPRGPAFAETPP
jgi:sec-independent protein translocase protein TatB